MKKEGKEREKPSESASGIGPIRVGEKRGPNRPLSGARKFILLFYIYIRKKPQLVSLLLTLCLILECRPKQLSNSENSKKKLRRKKRIKNEVIIREKQKKGKKKKERNQLGCWLAYLL